MPLDSSRLKLGECLSRIQYMTVCDIKGTAVTVKDESGFEWTVDKSILEKQAYSAEQFSATEKVTRTELARIVEQDIRDAAFSCAFNKLPTASDQDKLLENADISTAAKRKRIAKDLCTGAERILRGHIVDTHELGRMPVYDLENNGERLVDLRTLKWIIYNNTKYEVKP